MIRRIINRLRHAEPSRAPVPIERIGMPLTQSIATGVGQGARRGITVTPLDLVAEHRRAANRRARASRKANR